MRKYKICVLFLFIISLYCFEFVNANNNFPLLGKIVYLDPGHGGLWETQILRNDYKF